MCEAYAEKRGYRTDRRGRPDHQRAGSELVRDTVDGIVPLFFLPPNYTGDNVAISTQDGTTGLADDANEIDEDDSEDEKDVPTVAKGGSKQKEPKAKAVNAFSLLDSSSDDDSSDDE